MQTYSHTILTAVFNRRHREKESELPPLEPQASIIGSFAPDAPLTLLAVIFIMLDRLDPQENHSRTGHLFQEMFFHTRWVKALHNLFHAPILTFGYIGLGYLAWRRGKKWGAWLFWFGVSTSAHTLIDIPVHHNDGPLLLFPFDWETRYHSPVSYWDPKRYGRPFSVAEHLLDIILIGSLVRAWWQHRKSQK